MKPFPVALLAATALLLPAAMAPLAGQNVVSVQVGAARTNFWGSDHSHGTISGRSMRGAHSIATPLTQTPHITLRGEEPGW